MYRNSGKLQAGNFQGISFEIFSIEYRIWNTELDTLTYSISEYRKINIGNTLWVIFMDTLCIPNKGRHIGNCSRENSLVYWFIIELRGKS